MSLAKIGEAPVPSLMSGMGSGFLHISLPSKS